MLARQEEINLLKENSELYWKDVKHQAEEIKEMFLGLNLKTALFVAGLTGAFAVTEKYWKQDEKTPPIQKELKTLILEMILARLQENLEHNHERANNHE